MAMVPHSKLGEAKAGEMHPHYRDFSFFLTTFRFDHVFCFNYDLVDICSQIVIIHEGLTQGFLLRINAGEILGTCGVNQIHAFIF